MLPQAKALRFNNNVPVYVSMWEVNIVKVFCAMQVSFPQNAPPFSTSFGVRMFSALPSSQLRFLLVEELFLVGMSSMMEYSPLAQCMLFCDLQSLVSAWAAPPQFFSFLLILHTSQ